jgi:hypothetical protein
MRVGVYPGTFNPPTVAHLAIASAAREQADLDRLVLAVSVMPLLKEDVTRPLFLHRLDVLRESVRAAGDWIDVAVTEHRLIVDIARGYDAVVMGADKWAQVNDPRFYGDDPTARDAALAALPTVLVAPRPPFAVPPHLTLVVPVEVGHVSSTAAREGARSLMTKAAAAFDDRTGAWSEPERYDRWLATTE